MEVTRRRALLGAWTEFRVLSGCKDSRRGRGLEGVGGTEELYPALKGPRRAGPVSGQEWRYKVVRLRVHAREGIDSAVSRLDGLVELRGRSDSIWRG